MLDKEYKILQEFNSKRNQVSLIACESEFYVNKRFSDLETCNTEVQQLLLLEKSGCKVPHIHLHTEKQLILTYIDGKTLLDVFEDLEVRGAVESISKLVEQILRWLQNFYMANMQKDGSQLIKGDMNFRNFLLCDDEFYGIDFEQVRIGTIEEDIGRMSAFALMYDPIETSFKYDFVDAFIEKAVHLLELKEKLVIKYQLEELEAMKKRRKK